MCIAATGGWFSGGVAFAADNNETYEEGVKRLQRAYVEASKAWSTYNGPTD